jgi:hypothetical protein
MEENNKSFKQPTNASSGDPFVAAPQRSDIVNAGLSIVSYKTPFRFVSNSAGRLSQTFRFFAGIIQLLAQGIRPGFRLLADLLSGKSDNAQTGLVSRRIPDPVRVRKSRLNSIGCTSTLVISIFLVIRTIFVPTDMLSVVSLSVFTAAIYLYALLAAWRYRIERYGLVNVGFLRWFFHFNILRELASPFVFNKSKKPANEA